MPFKDPREPCGYNKNDQKVQIKSIKNNILHYNRLVKLIDKSFNCVKMLTTE